MKTRTSIVLWPALAGIAAASAGLGAAELASALFAPAGSPVLLVGAVVIDAAPAWLKEGVIALFGTNDKIVLILCVVLGAIILAALAGWLEYRRPPFGRVIVIIAGAAALLAAQTRANASLIDGVPAVVAMVIAAVLLTSFITLLRRDPAPAGEPDPNRRRFLVYTGTATGLGLIAALGGQALAAGNRAVDAARRLFTLPTAAVTAPPVPAGASLNIPGLAPVVTPNADFYRIDTALSVPRIDPSEWTLRIEGMVDNEIELSYADLLALPLEESITTLMCVSNEVGGSLIGNALWLGYPLRKLLEQAKPQAGADMVLSTSQDGWTAGTPLEALTDDRNSILAVGMNGQPLPLEHGYPVRMVVPGLYGYVSATKWVTTLKVSRFRDESAYWTDRGWSELGPIKMSSRIDVPRARQTVSAGTVMVAGTAWSQHLGIAGVQVQVDDQDWADAVLADAISIDTWRQWAYSWEATAGTHTLRVRATDADGLVQTSDRAPVVPDGATGLHEISVTVG